MNEDELCERIRAGRYPPSAVVCEEDGTQGRLLIVYDTEPPPAPGRVVIGRVGMWEETHDDHH